MKKGLPAVEAKLEVINHEAVWTHKMLKRKEEKKRAAPKVSQSLRTQLKTETFTFYSLQLCFHYYQLYVRGLFSMTHLFLVFIKA